MNKENKKITLILVGNSGIGKSTLIQRLIGNNLTTEATIGLELEYKIVVFKNRVLILLYFILI